IFNAFSTIGIALLLFIIGLGMNISELRRLGKPIFIAATTTLLTVGTLGYTVGSLMGFSRNEAIITAFALFFSSTIIIVKILSEKKGNQSAARSDSHRCNTAGRPDSNASTAIRSRQRTWR